MSASPSAKNGNKDKFVPIDFSDQSDSESDEPKPDKNTN